MAASSSAHGPGKALYGRVGLFRVFCPKCDEMSLSRSPDKCSEGHPVHDTPRTERRETRAVFVRNTPTAERQRELLEAQGHRCRWCDRPFGDWVVRTLRGVRATQLRVQWDHFIPYSYTGSCNDLEFVASCQICNGIKSNMVFDTEEECAEYLKREFARRYEDV